MNQFLGSGTTVSTLDEFLRKTSGMRVGKVKYDLATGNGTILRIIRRHKPRGKDFPANEFVDVIPKIPDPQDFRSEWLRCWSESDGTFYDIHEILLKEFVEEDGGEDHDVFLIGLALFGDI